MSTEALSSGSTFPPLKAGTLRIYSNRICPYAERARLVLAHKDIPNEVVNIHLSKKPEWFLEKINPLGKVPAIQKDDKIVYESAVCCDYLDQVYPGNKLTPDDPYQQARDRILVEHFGQVTTQYYKMLFGPSENCAAAAETLKKGLMEFDKEIQKRGDFFGGSEPRMIDFMIWPWFERFHATEKLVNQIFISDGSMPNLTAYMDRMLSVPAVQKCRLSTENHLEFYQSVKNGAPNYNVGL